MAQTRQEPARAKAEGENCTAAPTVAAPRDAAWERDAHRARSLAYASLVWMTAEGLIGLVAGLRAGSISLLGWALGSVVEGLASVIVVWRFTGDRALSATSERRAQRAVAVSFWLIAPFITIEAIRDLITAHRTETSAIGIAVTAASLLVMPALGRAKHRLGSRLGSAATAGEGTQNYLCAAQAATVLAGLAFTAAWSGGRWVDPVIALAIAAWSVREGVEAWHGEDCC